MILRLDVSDSSVARSYLTLCNPMDCSTPGFPVHHQLPELTQTHVHQSWWCHPTISSSVIPFSSRHQSFPASGSFQMSQFFASHGQILEFQLQHQSFQRIFKTDFLLDGLGWISLQSKGLSQESSPIPEFKASILQHSVLFIVQLSHPYVTTG